MNKFTNYVRYIALIAASIFCAISILKGTIESQRITGENISGDSITYPTLKSNDSSIVESRNLFKIPKPECLSNQNVRCRFDDVGQYLESAAKFTMINPQSDAIPEYRRIAPSMANNKTYLLNRRDFGPPDASQTGLVDYNPTIVPLASDWDEKLLDYVSGRYHPDISDEEADKVKYMYVSRSSNHHDCGNNGMRKGGHTAKDQSYLSIALLDENLQPIVGASASVLPNYFMFPRQYKKASGNLFQDYYLYVARSSKANPKKDQIFLYASDSKSYMFPMDLRRVPKATNSALDWNTKINNDPVPMIAEKGSSPDFFYGTGLQVRFIDCSKHGFFPFYGGFYSVDWKKNYHFFEIPDPDGVNGLSTFMELRPHWVRSTRKVNFYADNFHKDTDWMLVINGTYVGGRKRDDSKDFVNTWHRKVEKRESFSAREDTRWQYQFIDQGRGTACCVDIDIEPDSNETYKVGISHATTETRGYVSRFYAFSTKAPNFPLVALSGPFCFGSLNIKNDKNAGEMVSLAQNPGKLNDNITWYDCPHVTFASGITEYQKDKEYVIISYGVSDCYSRSIVVPKRRIIELLIGSFSQIREGTTAILEQRKEKMII